MTCREMTSLMKHCDKDAWTLFHRQYFDWLTAIALARSPSKMDASEIVQLTLLRAVRHIKVFENETAFKNWLSCLMRCVIIDLARQTQRKNLLLEKFSHWQESRHHGTHGYGLEDALETLSHDDAQLIRMKYVEGWSTRDLANRGKTTPKAIESKLARLRKQLRNHLTQQPERSHS